MSKSTVQTSFEQRLQKEKDLFIPFIMSGDPSPAATVELALTLQESGADILELGVPYSDPLADGPTIQEAAGRALQHGMNLKESIELVPKMRSKGLEIPVVLFTYYNPVLQYGLEQLFQDLREHDIDALLVPDIPLEESVELKEYAHEFGVELISLVAPNSEARIRKIAEQATGFLYCVSSLGVTGERKELSQDISSFLEKVKSYSSVPVAVGFGISTNEQVHLMKQYSDGVIIGSKIIKVINGYHDELVSESARPSALKKVKQEIVELVQ
ncbi:tryptophan synthase subunit alpha [Pontibacillus marinus]|uniref:Tryptophan synthase alpha chain n=1 Tax=Pontibacillus marinus BH030004 = DSM 16465 TaxID=1385511 RepID=A0A0A5GAQ9_9BACI|nr:tryptophan synthase subunit alpha [Pontibacillus marinus]KGX90261.1 tryptophan synthase subunit alpha [Pontibacillus marinus BH030004 = DSM 16465]